ncbi:endolytic transglycosylase MltG [Thalassiella azotivora]
MTELSLSELPGSRGSRREEERQRRRRRRTRRRRTVTVLAVCAVLFAAAAWVVVGFVRPLVEEWTAPKDYPGPGTGEAQVQVQAGDSGRAIGRTLAEAGVVLTADAFVDAARDEPRAGSIQPGTYLLRQEMAAADALQLLLDPASKVSVRVQVPEGLDVDETFEQITAATGFSADQLRQAAADPAVGLPAEAGGDPEGYLFPATYEFDPDVTPVEVLAAMVARHGEAMRTVGVPADRQREVLVKASIIEAEGRTPEDMARISTVIDNRLARGMKLQMDSTVNFATGKGGITTTAEDRATDSPYNTYLYAGMPPGPINSPGEAALTAALNPEPGPWLFFVTVDPGTGETRFAETEAGHAENVELFRQWLRENG